MLASQALTVQEAIGNRLTLGIGLAHKRPIEATLGIPFATARQAHGGVPRRADPGDDGAVVSLTGEIWSARGRRVRRAAERRAADRDARRDGPADAAASPGARTDGLILWLSGPRAIESTLKPAVAAAAAAARTAAPRIMASVPVCVTSKSDEVRGLIATLLAGYNELPSYRGVMDIEGVEGPPACRSSAPRTRCARARRFRRRRRDGLRRGRVHHRRHREAGDQGTPARARRRLDCSTSALVGLAAARKS